MEEQKDKFLNHIKTVLKAHEEPYEQGAWERFKKREEEAAPVIPVKRTIPVWKWAIAAAAVLTGIIFFAQILNHTSKPQPTTNSADPTQPSVTHTPAITRKDSSLQTPGTEKPAIATTQNAIEKNILKNEIYTHYPPPYKTLTQPQVIVTDSMITPKPIAPQIIVKEPQQKREVVDFYKNKIVEDQPLQQAQAQNKPVSPQTKEQVGVAKTTQQKLPDSNPKNKKWLSSLFVSPVFGELGVNMGYGYSVAYAVNNKLRVSTGIAHTKISTSRSYEAPATSSNDNLLADATYNNSFLSSRAVATYEVAPYLQNVQGSVSGIDIPVEINYSINKKMYATAGVSGMVVLNDRKEYTYVDNKNVRVTVETNKGTIKEDKVVNFQNSSTVSAPVNAPQEKVPFLGFYNISVGYRQKIYGKNAIALEPFVKVPMRNVTQQNLNYTGAGIKLKIDF